MSRVIIYGKKACPQCNMLTRWIDERNISFEYIDVSQYPELAEKLFLESGNASLPQYYYEGSWHYGFNIQKLQRQFNRE